MFGSSVLFQSLACLSGSCVQCLRSSAYRLVQARLADWMMCLIVRLVRTGCVNRDGGVAAVADVDDDMPSLC